MSGECLRGACLYMRGRPAALVLSFLCLALALHSHLYEIFRVLVEVGCNQRQRFSYVDASLLSFDSHLQRGREPHTALLHSVYAFPKVDLKRLASL